MIQNSSHQQLSFPSDDSERIVSEARLEVCAAQNSEVIAPHERKETLFNPDGFHQLAKPNLL